MKFTNLVRPRFGRRPVAVLMVKLFSLGYFHPNHGEHTHTGWERNARQRGSDLAAARTFFELAIASSGSTPRLVITDKAVRCPPALAAAVPGVLRRTGRYRTNGIERDHGFLKQRLRPMRGLETLPPSRVLLHRRGVA
jgi:hypothetical protein